MNKKSNSSNHSEPNVLRHTLLTSKKSKKCLQDISKEKIDENNRNEIMKLNNIPSVDRGDNNK